MDWKSKNRRENRYFLEKKSIIFLFFSVCSPSSSVASSATPSTSSPVDESRQCRKRSLSPSTTSSTTAPPPPPQPPTKKGMKPNPLNLTATSNFSLQPSISSPLLMLQQHHQNSPLFQAQISQLYTYAALASAGLYGPQISPHLASQSPFRSPLVTPKNLGLGELGSSGRTPGLGESQVGFFLNTKYLSIFSLFISKNNYCALKIKNSRFFRVETSHTLRAMRL